MEILENLQDFFQLVSAAAETADAVQTAQLFDLPELWGVFETVERVYAVEHAIEQDSAFASHVLENSSAVGFYNSVLQGAASPVSILYDAHLSFGGFGSVGNIGQVYGGFRQGAADNIDRAYGGVTGAGYIGKAVNHVNAFYSGVPSVGYIDRAASLVNVFYDNVPSAGQSGGVSGVGYIGGAADIVNKIYGGVTVYNAPYADLGSSGASVFLESVKIFPEYLDIFSAKSEGVPYSAGIFTDAPLISEESLTQLRELADRETVNRFTTAEIKIDWNNTQNISSELDMDSVTEYFEAGLLEAAERAARGLH